MIDTDKLNTLVFSCRQQNSNLAASSFYEFEDLIIDWMNADLLAPKDLPYNVRRKVQTMLYRVTHSQSLVRPLSSPKLGPHRLNKKYDLIFATLPNMGTTYKIFDFADLRQSCEVLACYVPEVWVKGLAEYPFQVEPLKQCDHIFVSTEHSAEVLSRMTGRPCTFLHFAVDAVKFSPHPFFPKRYIDVLNIGRRSPVAHKALLDAAATSDFHYVYDTVNSTKFIDAADHRSYYANAAKRSKFYIANIANFDQDWKTGGVVEFGHRFYEGIAAGTVVVGSFPEDHPVFRSDFDWTDSIIPVPQDAEDIVEILRQLEADSARIEAVRRANVVNAVRRHDFVYRWADILGILGMDPTARMKERVNLLEEIAADLERGEDRQADRAAAKLSAV